ncbi:ADP/ATP carrier receptor [Rhizoctonia solani AG-1 IA]|uniref:ADP/ATP carrier receptor n=1 Tax=Thanatephorus cucumeris (strain AG1-IA) TaxID=983506 RepID=L8WL34_THACA|nr:ADP/ATP carrier receptor [Rhizoctonia solani AG-1 IA]
MSSHLGAAHHPIININHRSWFSATPSLVYTENRSEGRLSEGFLLQLSLESTIARRARNQRIFAFVVCGGIKPRRIYSSQSLLKNHPFSYGSNSLGPMFISTRTHHTNLRFGRLIHTRDVLSDTVGPLSCLPNPSLPPPPNNSRLVGSFGQVFQGIQRKNNQLVAVKQVKFNMFAEGIPGLGLREISNLGVVTHKHIAKYSHLIERSDTSTDFKDGRLIYADVSPKGSVYIVMEYVDMDLHRYIKVVKNNNDGAALPEPLIQNSCCAMCAHVVRGALFLKLPLLGGVNSLNQATTLAYRAPDIILGERLYTAAFDMWSAGCVVAEMARAGDTLFRCRSLNLDQQLEEIFKNLGTPNEDIWPGVSKLPGWKEFEHWEPKQAADLFPGLSVNGMDLILVQLGANRKLTIVLSRKGSPPSVAKQTCATPVSGKASTILPRSSDPRQCLKLADSPNPRTMAPTPTPSEDSIVERVQTFVGENRRVVIGAAAAVTALGIGYLVYSRSSGDKGDKKKPSKDKKKKGRRVDQTDGPIIEERNPALDEAEIKALPTEDRLKRAAELKSRGNSAYTQRDFELAVNLYSQAIAMSPKPEAVFYSNRAACYTNFKPPQHQKVIEDCTQALKLDPKYAKALNRRATALEAIDNLKDALRDFTALAIIERFKNDAASAAVERVLAKLSTKQAEEIMRAREPRLPSVTFIGAYFAAFRPRPNVILPDYATKGDHMLLEAQEALSESQFTKAHELVNAAIDAGLSENWNEGLGEALNLRGTFKFLMGDTVGAKADFVASTQAHPDLVQSWVKIASVYMELSEAEAAFAAFESAIEKDPNCADIYYHRGQESGRGLPEVVQAGFQVCVLTYPTCGCAVQNGRSRLFNGLIPPMLAFLPEPRRTVQLLVSRGLRWGESNLRLITGESGELLLDQQRFQEAIEKFDRSIEIERQKWVLKILPNPLPLVNKALALYQWQQDLPSATQLCKEALTLDDECDAAVATLAQLSLQQGRVEEAIDMFSKHASIARTEAELVQALSYENASRAQLEFQKNYPDMAGQLAAMAQGMQAPF